MYLKKKKLNLWNYVANVRSFCGSIWQTTSPLQSVTVSLHPGGTCSMDGDFASPQPLNSSYIRLQNCWTINFSKAQRGFAGARTLHTPWQQSINQSRNQAMKQRSADTLNFTAQTGANHRGGGTKARHPFYPTMLDQSLQLSQTDSSWSTRETNWLDSMTSVAISVAVSIKRRGLSHTHTLVCRTHQQTWFSGIPVSKADRWASGAVA